MCRQSLPQEIALIGFAGAPWTLACYFVEGGSSRHFATLKTLMYQHPDALMALLDHLTETVTAMALAQIQAGAQVIQLFDSWAGILSEAHYQTFALSL